MFKKQYKKEFLIFLIILSVAVFFRLYQLDSIPPGLWPDEAANGVDALKAIDGNDFKIFYPANNGREGLFINLQAVSVKLFGPTPWALRIISASIGILTVVGLYLLSRHLFGWTTAAIASYLLAISFWHVNFSRIGLRAIMLPLILVYAFYFLWRGLRSGRLSLFFIAGIIGGLGFYTYFSFRIVPLIAIILFINYWSYLKKDFPHVKYEYIKVKLLQGFSLLVIVTIFMALPLGIYFFNHPEDFLKREGRPISVFEQEQPRRELGLSIVRTLGMLNFRGDQNERHNIPGAPMLPWPVGVLFAVGFLKELSHWLARKHGHFSTVHTFLLSWFFITLLPGFLTTEAPHALRTIGVVPVVMIFAARGLEWFLHKLSQLHQATDPHFHFNTYVYRRESVFLTIVAVIAVLTSLGFLEYSRYFRDWGIRPSTRNNFTQKYVDMAYYINQTALPIPKYILVNAGDVLVDGVPNDAQTIKFLTLSHNRECSLRKNIYYLRSDQLFSEKFPSRYILIPLTPDPKLQTILMSQFGLHQQRYDSFTVFSK